MTKAKQRSKAPRKSKQSNGAPSIGSASASETSKVKGGRTEMGHGGKREVFGNARPQRQQPNWNHLTACASSRSIPLNRNALVVARSRLTPVGGALFSSSCPRSALTKQSRSVGSCRARKRRRATRRNRKAIWRNSIRLELHRP